ncbi:hypothetical protein L1887_51114 [Cichorium endivia]|nr:hypothetical protein L1887_51114 [Cichorium endivia]
MIGRADIEGSKSNVAMNAWLPQASYPCGNFSDTSSFKFRRSKGSLGHAFTVRIRTGNQNQTSFYPSVPHEISVLVELILGHLRYLLTDVPPQPNSPPDNVFRPDRPAEAGLGSKKRGIAPLPIHGISKITLKVVVFHFRPRAPTYTTPLKSFHKVGLESSSTGRIPLVRTSSELAVRRPGKAPEGAVPSPSPGRHAATRSRRGSSSSSPPTADGFGTGTPVPSPQSQSFSRGYGSILPTSLAYIVPSTRGCSPWRPDAVMSTTGRGRHSVLRIFKGRRGRTGHRATCGALPAAGPYLRLSHERFARQYRCGPPPEFPLASPRSGIVHHLSGPDRHAHTRTLLRRSRPVPGARRYIAETARAANHDRRDGISTSLSTARALAAAPIRTGPRPESIGGPAIAVPHPTGTHRRPPFASHPDNFKHSLTLFSKSFSSFPRAPRGATGSGHDGALTLSGAPFQGTWARSAAEDASPDYNSDSEAVRFSSWADPVPPDLGSRFEASSQDDTLGSSSRASLTAHDARHNTRVFSTTTSRASTEGDSSLGQPHHKHGETNLRPDAMCPDKGCMVGGDAMRDAQAGVPSAGWLWAQLAFKNSMVHVHGSFCFAGFDNDPSAGSPTETLLRLLLPLNDKVQWNSRDVAGGEPPTACFEHSNFFKVTAPEARPGQLRPGAHRRQKGRAGITAAAGTRLALQWILVKGFRLYSFQLPDSFEPGIVIYCHYLPVSGLGNLRACCLPWMW